MYDYLGACPQPADAGMRLSEATEEQYLKEQHACGPDGRRASEPRQDELADKRLDQEEQKRAECNRKAISQHEGKVYRFRMR